MGVFGVVLFLKILLLVNCGYPPIGDEVQPGSVLLPSTRRGRYLANIVRRQAVDGTGIKFNKEADRMNADAKKKVDVLSEELLPYIIAEQERRTTLYKRVMTAIQNGEKGVTIAEIRNKDPLFIRKGLMYRCPPNRAPREPDGSGIIMCEYDIEPSPIMFDSCLSAEDRELYVADNNYFFCNRHRVEGPDLPRNGSTVVACSPIERTSLNYTLNKCALEDTDDVVVHYRYYPDRTYKYVTELDPDKEVCDHWDPCQIGYIFSLANRDQALQATELWANISAQQPELDEFIQAIPEDSKIVNVFPDAANYTSSARRVKIPEGFQYSGVERNRHQNSRRSLKKPWKVKEKMSADKNWMIITLHVPKWSDKCYGPYFASFIKKVGKKIVQKFVEILNIERGKVYVKKPKRIELMPGQKLGEVSVPFTCGKCTLLRITVRGCDWNVYNLDPTKYKVIDGPEKQINLELDNLNPKYFGTFMAIFLNEERNEEIVQLAIVRAPKKEKKSSFVADLLNRALPVGGLVNDTVNYECDKCEPRDVHCEGKSIVGTGVVTIVRSPKILSFNIPSFEDNNSCVYIVTYKKGLTTYRKQLAVLENNSPAVKVTLVNVTAPKLGDAFEQRIPVACVDCNVFQVSVNGLKVDLAEELKDSTESYIFYTVENGDTAGSISGIVIHITEYGDAFEGIYQAKFEVDDGPVTKTILIISEEKSSGNDEPEDDDDEFVDYTNENDMSEGEQRNNLFIKPEDYESQYFPETKHGKKENIFTTSSNGEIKDTRRSNDGGTNINMGIAVSSGTASLSTVSKVTLPGEHPGIKNDGVIDKGAAVPHGIDGQNLV